MNVDFVSKRNNQEVAEYDSYSKIDINKFLLNILAYFNFPNPERIKVEMKPETIDHDDDAESSHIDARSRQCPYLDTINR